MGLVCHRGGPLEATPTSSDIGSDWTTTSGLSSQAVGPPGGPRYLDLIRAAVSAGAAGAERGDGLRPHGRRRRHGGVQRLQQLDEERLQRDAVLQYVPPQAVFTLGDARSYF